MIEVVPSAPVCPPRPEPARRAGRSGAGGLGVPLWAAALFLTLAACRYDLPAPSGAPGADPLPAPESLAAPAGTRATAAVTEASAGAPGEPRPISATRLWIGIWCDRGLLSRDGAFAVSVDGVELLRSDAACRGGDAAAGASPSPNGGSVALTLDRGPHVLGVSAPDGEGLAQRFMVVDDTWILVDHREPQGGGAYLTTARVQTEPVAADPDYDPRTRPVGPGAGAQRPVHAAPAEGSAPTTEPPLGLEIDEDPLPGARGPSAHARRRARPAGDWMEGTPAFLTVTSDVPADVEIDGRVRGRTPLVDFSVRAGLRRIVVRPTDSAWPPRTFSVTLEAGQRRTLASTAHE